MIKNKVKLFVFFLLPLLIAEAKKPNILFIFADDQCYETIRELKITDIDTPHLDRLMKAGTSFTRAYNMGSWSGAVCVASRHMLNTGRFIWDAEIASKNAEQERSAGRWWSEYIKKAGYTTYMTGKWHVQADAEKCFDVVRNLRGGMPNQTPEGIIVHCQINRIHGAPSIPNLKVFGREENTGAKLLRMTPFSFSNKQGNINLKTLSLPM